MSSFEIFDSHHSIMTIAPDRTTESSERVLCRALLYDAIKVATGITPNKDDACYEAQRWLRAKDDDWVFPCVSVCALIGIDQAAMLKSLEPRFMTVASWEEKRVRAVKKRRKELFRKRKYIGRVKGCLNKSTIEKTPRITEMLKDGRTVTDITVAIGVSRNTVCAIRKTLKAELATFLCGCGRKNNHRGWCRYRCGRSPGRQRKGHLTIDSTGLTDSDSVFLQTEIAGR